MDIIVTLLSYLAVWFLGACSLAAALCVLFTLDKKQRARNAAALKTRLENAEEPPKSGPILHD